MERMDKLNGEVVIGTEIAHLGMVIGKNLGQETPGSGSFEDWWSMNDDETMMGPSSDQSDCDHRSQRGGSLKRKLADASRLARTKRREELETLREENKSLLSERAQLMQKIESLEARMNETLGEASINDVYENDLLKEQIRLHSQFMDSFRSAVQKLPSEQSARKKIYKEGADNASTYLLSLLAESQGSNGWQRAPLPIENCVLPMQVFFKLTDNLFQDDGESPSSSSSSSSSTSNGRKKAKNFDITKPRLQLRFDITFNGVDVATVTRVLNLVFCDHNFLTSLAPTPEINGTLELKPLSEELEDTNTKLLYHRRTFPGEETRDAVLLHDHRKMTMTRSTLALPKNAKDPASTVKTPPSKEDKKPTNRKRGRPVGSKKKQGSLPFGSVEVDMISRVSTSLLAGACRNTDATRITSPIIHGAFVFDDVLEPVEEEEVAAENLKTVTRAVILTSTTQEYKEIFSNWGQILSPNGFLTQQFATYMVEMASMFYAMHGANPHNNNV